MLAEASGAENMGTKDSTKAGLDVRGVSLPLPSTQTQQHVFVFLPAIPYGLVCAMLSANVHLVKNITTLARDPLLQRGWESKHHRMSSVCIVRWSSEQKGSHQKTLYCPEGQVTKLGRQGFNK